MIYVDTSVALATLLAEDVAPPASLWSEPLIASRLLTYELWTRLHARGLTASHEESAHDLLGRISLVEMSPVVLERALHPFGVPVRTPGAMHLATIEFLRGRGQQVRLATYDRRLRDGAEALGVEIYPLG